MTKQTFTQKSTGDSLSASEWNDLTSYVNTAVDAINGAGGAGSSSAVTVTDETASGGDPTVGIAIASGVQQIGSPKVIELTKKKKGVNTTITAENNINFEPRESAGETKGGNISFKPGDDIEFCSHHRLQENQDEVSFKVIDGNDNPVKLQLNAAEMTLTTKGKTGDNAAVFDINVNSAKNTKGYLKVRAQAIDLRCEEHGGIALQPKGKDSNNHENKIKFEHGGGDGLEFGTFNSEKTSLYTGEYRFKKTGLIKLSTRNKVASDKYDGSDSTTHYKYEKNQSDDFYDFIDSNDPACTWKDILSYVVWAKTHHEGPFDISYLLNDQIDNKQRYIVFDSSYAPNTTQNLLESITSIKIMYVSSNPNEDPTEVTLYPNTLIGAGASGEDNGTYYYNLHFQSNSHLEENNAGITKDVAVQFRPDGTIWMDRIITFGTVNGVPSTSLSDATEYITNVTYSSNS